MMYSSIIFISLFIVYNANSQECGLPSNLPLPIKNLLLGNPFTGIAPPCSCIKACPDPNCGCIGTVIQAPTVPPCGCYNPAIGLQNPIIGVQSCACQNAYTCSCGNPVVGNLCGRSTPTVGLATTCGCSDPTVRIVDGCPRCQPVYSYNLPSLGYPSCGVPSYLPPALPYSCGTCSCGTCSCGCGIPNCNCGAPISLPYTLPCGTCSSCGSPVNSCGCVEVPCGLPVVKTTCTCVTPTLETPCGCIQGKPACSCATTVEVPTCGVPVLPPFPPVIGCSRYLRKVCVNPPFL